MIAQLELPNNDWRKATGRSRSTAAAARSAARARPSRRTRRRGGAARRAAGATPDGEQALRGVDIGKGKIATKKWVFESPLAGDVD